MPAMWEDMCSNGRGPYKSEKAEVSEEKTETEKDLQELEEELKEGLQI